MFQHILIPVDGSATALHAAQKAAELASHFGSAITAIYVMDPHPFSGIGADFAYGQAQYSSAAQTEADTALQAVRSIMRNAQITNAQTRICQGHTIHDTIATTAHDIGADLIVIGSNGRRGLERLMLGSVAQRVLQTANTPVLVVRAPTPATAATA